MSLGGQNEDRDRYSGYLTTGHDWNGIKELNTRVPKLLLACLAAAFIFSLGYWYLLPAWPLGNDYTRGKLGIDQKQELAEQQATAAIGRSSWSDLIKESSFEAIGDDPRLMTIVQKSGPALFKDNCAGCHGQNGAGGLYFPSLSDNSWLWGGSPDQIYKTLQVGINSGAEGSRVAVMPAYGATGILDANDISNVALYVRSLSSEQLGDGSKATEALLISQGKAIFKTNCSACHGAEGTGNTALGAPNLTDKFWIYGGDKASITQTLQNGRAGLMPSWSDRLDEVELKMLSLYVAQMSTDDRENTGE